MKAFSLTETLATIALIALLASLLLPTPRAVNPTRTTQPPVTQADTTNALSSPVACVGASSSF